MRIGDFFKRIKVKEQPQPSNIEEKEDIIQNIEIEIKDNIDLFKDEKEQIMKGAKQLIELGRAKNMEEAIITIAVMFRGLKYCETKETEDGRKIVVLKEIAIQEDRQINDDGIEL